MPESLIRKKIARLLSHVYDSDKPYAITYTIDDQYLWLKVQKIAQLGKRYLLRCKLLNITRNAIQIEQMKVNGLEKDLYDLYQAIVINDLDRGTCQPSSSAGTTTSFIPVTPTVTTQQCVLSDISPFRKKTVLAMSASWMRTPSPIAFLHMAARSLNISAP